MGPSENVQTPTPDNFNQKDKPLNSTEQTILDSVIYKKKEKISHIIILVIVIAIAIAMPLLALWFLLGFLSDLPSSKPDYDINTTKDNWNKLVEGLPNHFDFDIISEDETNGVLTIGYGDKKFGYKCHKELAAAGLSSYLFCGFVFDNKDTRMTSFTDLLWYFHKEELYKLIEDMPEVAAGDKDDYIDWGNFVVGESDPKILFDLIMTIEDYRIFYNYIYEKYSADPSSNCSVEKDICSIRDNDYQGTIKIKGKKVVRTGSSYGQSWEELSEYKIHMLVWALSSGAVPTLNR